MHAGPECEYSDRGESDTLVALPSCAVGYAYRRQLLRNVGIPGGYLVETNATGCLFRNSVRTVQRDRDVHLLPDSWTIDVKRLANHSRGP
jgi:hypothetical protein